MGYSSDAQLIVGISLQKFFRKVGEKTNTYDEHDQKGNKTGKKITERKLVATLPDGNEVVIGEYYKSEYRYNEEINFDFYSSLSFDGNESDQTDLELHNTYENENLETIYIGYHFSTDEECVEIPIQELNDKILLAQKELKEKFYYDGVVELYLVHGEYC